MYRRFLRPGWMVGHLLVAVAVLVCLRLGVWQWHRTREANGTVQNLGYAVLWPLFAGAFIYMWFRFLQLELLKDAEDDAELTRMAAGSESGTAQSADLRAPDAAAAATTFGSGSIREAAAGDAVEPPAGAADAVPPMSRRTPPRRTPSHAYTVAVSTVGDETEEDEPELAAYNRALAALAEKDHRRAR